MVAGLEAPEEGHSVPRLTFELPVADQLRNELGLLVQTHAADDAVQSEGEEDTLTITQRTGLTPECCTPCEGKWLCAPEAIQWLLTA